MISLRSNVPEACAIILQKNKKTKQKQKKKQQRYVFFSLCPESKKENLLPKDIFLATLNWEAFTFTTIFVQQCVLV